MLIRVAQKIFPCCSLFFMSPLSLYKKFCGYNRKKCTISAFSSSLYQRAGYYTKQRRYACRTFFCFEIRKARGLEGEAVLNDSPGDCQIRGMALPAGKGVLAPNEVALCANGHAFGVIKVVKKLSKCSQILFKNVVQLPPNHPIF